MARQSFKSNKAKAMTDETIEQLSWDAQHADKTDEDENVPAQQEGSELDKVTHSDEETSETLPVVADRTRLPANEALSIGQMAVQSLVMGTNNPYEAAMKVMRGHELGLPPVASMENLFVVNGKTGMGAALIGTLIKKSSKYNYRVTEHDDQHCAVVFFENGEEIGTSTFSMQDAEKAGLVKPRSPWTTYPRNMLLARALSNGARWYCPDVFQGSVYTDEELRSVQVSSDTQPTQQATSYSAPPTPAAPPVADGFMAEPPALVREDWTVGEVYDTEMCPLHYDDAGSISAAMYRGQQRPVAFFKAGRMRSYAHKTGDGWCDRESAIKEIAEDAMSLFNNPDDMQEFAINQFPDLAGIVPDEYRAIDWWFIRNARTDS